MKKFILFYFLILFTTETKAQIKEKIIQNLLNTKNISFNFEQNINGKVENGNCIIEYPKKINCKYNLSNQKILISNGKTSTLFAVATTKTGVVFSANQVIKVAKTRFVVPLSPLFCELANALSISSIHKTQGANASAI